MNTTSENNQTAKTGSRVPVLTGLAGVLLATFLLLQAAFGAPVQVSLLGTELFFADRPGALVALLVAIVLLLVQSYGARYLQDEAYRSRFHRLAALAALGSAIVAIAATPVVFAAGWVLTGLALVALVGLDRRLAQSGAARVLTRRSEIASGVAVIAAAAICLAADVGSFQSAGSGSSIEGAAAVLLPALLIIAAIARCAQLFAGRWLQLALTAPTPVSALMHAGIVNAGAMIVLRYGDFAFTTTTPAVILFVVAAMTMIVVTAAMIARPDIKGSLALSTRGQMGFMLIQCALGAFAGALFHLISHGLYKATLFLGAGSAIAQYKERVHAPPTHRQTSAVTASLQMLSAALVPLAFLVAAIALIMPSAFDDPAKLALFAFTWSAAAQAQWWWLRLRSPDVLGSAASVLAVGGFVFAYVAAFAAFDQFVVGELAVLPLPAPSWLVFPLFAIVFATTLVRWFAEAQLLGAARGRFTRSPIYLGLYARSLRFGHMRQRVMNPQFRPQPIREVS